MRREAALEMKDRLGLETERTMASSDTHKDWVVGGNGTPWEEAMRLDLLLENSSEAPIVAEPRGAQRHELVLEGGMDAGIMDVVSGAGAHFENLVGSMKDRARRRFNASGRAMCFNFCLLTWCEGRRVYILVRNS